MMSAFRQPCARQAICARSRTVGLSISSTAGFLTTAVQPVGDIVRAVPGWGAVKVSAAAANRGCSVRHVIEPVLGRDRDRTIIVLVTYLDDSGTDWDSPVVTMAGYVAGFAEWQRFESGTDGVFDRYEIPFFHSKEFHDTKCQFSGWSRIKKNSFVDEWYGVASPFVRFGISISVQKKTYDLRKLQLGLGQNMSAFGFCFNVVIDRLLREPEIGRIVAADGLSFIVESGTTYNSSLERIFHGVMRRHNLESRLKSVSFADKRQCKALQLADLLSFYAKRHFVQCNKRGRNIPVDGILQRVTRRIRTWAFFANNFGKVRPLSDWTGDDAGGD